LYPINENMLIGDSESNKGGKGKTLRGFNEE
jgi:hypothetical protein